MPVRVCWTGTSAWIPHRGTRIRITGCVDSTRDDEFSGFTCGHQGQGPFYHFDWKRGTRTFVGAMADRSLGLKIAHTPRGTNPSLIDLWWTTYRAAKAKSAG